MSENRFIEQNLLRLNTESTIIPYSYSTGEFSISITGGSGTGDYHWRIIPVSGMMTTSNDQMEYHGSSDTISLKFVESGTVILTVYKDGSLISDNNYYIQSKTLDVELLLSEKEIKIVVDPETKVYPLGHSYNTSDFSILHPNTTDPEYNDVLSTKPSLYIPYNLIGSDDFYRFDVFEKASGSGYSNGVQFINNNNGTWTIKGTPLSSGVAYYNLIVSDTKLPDYIFKLTKYLYVTSISSEPVSIQFIQYFPNNVETTTTLDSSDSDVVFSDKVCGLVIRFKVTSTIDSTVAIHLYSFKDRYVDTVSESSYHVSASGGVVDESVLNTYSKTLDYKSSKFKFSNYISYPIVDMGDLSKHTITGLEVSYYPKTDVVFTVKAKPNYYFVDGWDDNNIKTTSEAYTYDPLWGPWWSDEEVNLCWGTGESLSDSNYFRIRSKNPFVTPDHYENVPFHRLSSKFDEDGRLVEGTYWIKMPANSTELMFKFSQIFNSESSWTWPYIDTMYDASATGSTYVLVLKDKAYADAMLFCYYARSSYFPGDSSTNRLLDSPYENTGVWLSERFFRLYPPPEDTEGDLRMSPYLNRGDMIKSLRRMSHEEDFYDSNWTLYSTSAASNVISRDPDRYIHQKSIRSNNPDAIASSYAGYPPKLDWQKLSYNMYYPYSSSYGTIRWTSGQVVAKDQNTSFANTRYFRTHVIDATHDPIFAEEAAVSDFLTNARDIPSYSWGAWTGVIDTPSTYISSNFNPQGLVSWEEAITTLWKYAKFRQFDISTDPFYTPPSALNSEFVSNPACLWALSRGFITGYYCPYSWLNTMPSGVPLQPGTAVNRAEWAYMLSKFCQAYAW